MSTFKEGFGPQEVYDVDGVPSGRAQKNLVSRRVFIRGAATLVTAGVLSELLNPRAANADSPHPVSTPSTPVYERKGSSEKIPAESPERGGTEFSFRDIGDVIGIDFAVGANPYADKNKKNSEYGRHVFGENGHAPFDILMPQGVFLMENTHEKGKFELKSKPIAAALVNRAQESGMKVHGHSIFFNDWTRQHYDKGGAWVDSITDPHVIVEGIDKRVKVLTTFFSPMGFGGDVKYWTVGNEMIRDDGTPWDSVWSKAWKKIHPDAATYDWLSHAYDVAHKANSEAGLLYVDFGVDKFEGPKSAAYREVLAKINKDTKVPVIAGMQVRVYETLDFKGMQNQVDALRKLGVKDIVIEELYWRPDFKDAATEIVKLIDFARTNKFKWVGMYGVNPYDAYEVGSNLYDKNNKPTPIFSEIQTELYQLARDIDAGKQTKPAN